jgi:hypothetical protein
MCIFQVSDSIHITDNSVEHQNLGIPLQSRRVCQVGIEFIAESDWSLFLSYFVLKYFLVSLSIVNADGLLLPPDVIDAKGYSGLVVTIVGVILLLGAWRRSVSAGLKLLSTAPASTSYN